MYFIFATLLVLIDQAIKYKIRTTMSPFDTIPIIQDFFHITYVQNRGAAFGIFQEGTLVFAGITVVVLGILIYYSLKFKNMNRLWKVTLTMITSGAVGNLIDRLYLGYVVDMFDFRGIWSFIFNFADVCVVVGGCTVIFLVLRDKKILENKA